MYDTENAAGRMEIRRSDRGYYTLYVDGQFEGNYDNYTDAVRAYEEL